MIALVIMIVGLIPYNSIDFGFAMPFIDKMLILLLYQVKIPIYLLLLSILLGLFYLIKIRSRYEIRAIDIEFLTGHWKNEWTVDGTTHSETCEIKSGGRYYIMGQHWFDLIDFSYDKKSNKMKFTKSAVQNGDRRTALNILKVVDNDLISGKEEAHDIRYSRL